MALLVLAAGCKEEDTAPEPDPENFAVTGITLNKTDILLGIGDIESLSATIAPENAINKKVTWTSGSENIATVDTAGKVTAVAIGETNIIVTTE